MLFAPFETLEECKAIKRRYVLYLLFRQMIFDPLRLSRKYSVTYDKTIALW